MSQMVWCRTGHPQISQIPQIVRPAEGGQRMRFRFGLGGLGDLGGSNPASGTKPRTE